MSIFDVKNYKYLANGVDYYGTPARFTLGDPVIYFDANGLAMLSAADYPHYKNTAYAVGTLKTALPIELAEVKEWIRVDHGASDTTLKMLLAAAYSAADLYMGRMWTAGQPELEAIKLVLLQLIGYYYENRGEIGGALPALAIDGLAQFRREPGF